MSNDTKEATEELTRALDRGRDVMAAIAGSRVGRRGVQVGHRAGQVGHRAGQVPEPVKHLAGAVANPARFWSMAATGSLGGGEAVDGKTAADLAEVAIRAAAARLKLGDFDQVRETLLGQAAWLGANAVRLMAMTADVPEGPKAAEQRAELVRLSLRASEQAAKVAAAAAGLNAIQAGKNVSID